jgi:hypothetical protein
MDASLELLGRFSPSFATVSLGASLALALGENAANTAPADTAR